MLLGRSRLPPSSFRGSLFEVSVCPFGGGGGGGGDGDKWMCYEGAVPHGFMASVGQVADEAGEHECFFAS